MGIPPWMWKWGRPWPAPSAPRPCRTQGAFPFRVSLSALPGQSSHLAAIHGDTPMEVEMARPDQLSISLPGISRLPGAQPSLLGVRPPPGFTGTLMGSGEFSGPGQTPAIRQAPPLHIGGIRPLPNRTMATITSVTAPVVTMASYGGVSTSISLGRPFPLWA